MGLGFRSSIRLLPSLRVNLSKSGASLSAGRRGATVNVGRRGIRGTVGLPGSGLSYSESAPWHHRVGQHARTNAAPLLGFVILVALAAVLFATR